MSRELPGSRGRITTDGSSGSQHPMASRALLLASTYNHLLMSQAVVELVRGRYEDVQILWFGSRPLAELSDLLVLPDSEARWLDFHGYGRFKLWRSSGSALHREVMDRLSRELEHRADQPLDVYLGNECELLAQAVMAHSRATWNDVTLYEEGVGFYCGSNRYLEKAAVNTLLALRRYPYREFYRNFSHNPRIRRLACNHPALVERNDVEILDTRERYRAVIERAARRVEAKRSTGSAPAVECLYVSGNLSGARQMRLSEELALLELLHGRLCADFGSRIHVKFHPREDSLKREAVIRLGFEELAFDGPFEVEYLTRPYRNVFSIRSSVMLNLMVLDDGDVGRRLWLLRSERQPFRGLYRPAVARTFDHAVASCAAMEYLDPYAPRSGGRSRPLTSARRDHGAGAE